MNNRLAALMMMGAALGMNDRPYSGESNEPKDTDSDFVKRSKEFRKRAKETTLFYRSNKPYRRPIPKTIKGKLALKHAKRQKVRAMKAEVENVWAFKEQLQGCGRWRKLGWWR